MLQLEQLAVTSTADQLQNKLPALSLSYNDAYNDMRLKVHKMNTLALKSNDVRFAFYMMQYTI